MNRSPRSPILIPALTLLALLLFLSGIFAPLLTANKYIFFSRTVSLFTILRYLLSEKEYLLFSGVFIAGILFPALKLAIIVCLRNGKVAWLKLFKQRLGGLARYARWAAVELFLVAFLVFRIENQVNARVEFRYGLYCFAAAVLLILFLLWKVAAASRQPSRPERTDEHLPPDR